MTMSWATSPLPRAFPNSIAHAQCHLQWQQRRPLLLQLGRVVDLPVPVLFVALVLLLPAVLLALVLVLALLVLVTALLVVLSVLLLILLLLLMLLLVLPVLAALATCVLALTGTSLVHFRVPKRKERSNGYASR